MKGILDSWGVDPFYLFVVMFIIQIVMIVLYVMLNTKYRRLQKSYVTFMRGKNGKNLEQEVYSPVSHQPAGVGSLLRIHSHYSRLL